MPENEIAIDIQNVSKNFVLASEKRGSLKEAFVTFGQKRKVKQQHVLKDVSFSINKGDFFGIVGRNGSGKSTLLKIIAGVYQASKGGVAINGSLTPFIELGVGFNPELSGHDNVYLNGALLGFSRQEMQSIYDDIVEFAELQDSMNKKLKNYSSGMQVRLAFSIAIKAKKDILIFDEVLAVGDEAFQAKCLRVFEEYKANGQTVVLVTHDMATVRRFCNKAALINNGVLDELGSPAKIAKLYTDLNEESIGSEIDKMEKRESRLKVSVADKQLKPGDQIKIDVEWDKALTNIISIGINIFKISGEHVTGVNTKNDGISWFSPDLEKISVAIDTKLNVGEYKILVEAFRDVGKVEDYNDDTIFRITSSEPINWSGVVDVSRKWLR